jgi:hypothetical protein
VSKLTISPHNQKKREIANDWPQQRSCWQSSEVLDKIQDSCGNKRKPDTVQNLDWLETLLTLRREGEVAPDCGVKKSMRSPISN